MTAYADLTARVSRLVAEDALNSALLYDAICVGLDATLPWIAPRRNQTITGDGSETAFSLNADVFEIDAVELVATGEFLPKAMLAPGYVRGNYMAGDNNWLEYPSGTLSFSVALDEDAEAKVYYRGHWDKPTDEDDTTFVMTIPGFLEYPVTLYAASYVLIPSAVETAEVRQFGTRVDSGNPSHNPMADRVNFLLKLFRNEMNGLPKQVSGVYS